jgi:ferredoxin
MIVTEGKQSGEIVKSLKKVYANGSSIFIAGCGNCAAKCKTGDEEALKMMKILLEKENFKTAGTAILDSCCSFSAKESLIENPSFKKADIVLTLCCGAGAQNIEMFSGKTIVSGLNSKAAGSVCNEKISEFCRVCGNCILSETMGICPKTRCAKSLVNGPCGGYIDGRCEADYQKPCIWLSIYAKIKKDGKLGDFAKSIICD